MAELEEAEGANSRTETLRDRYSHESITDLSQANSTRLEASSSSFSTTCSSNPSQTMSNTIALYVPSD